MNKWHTCQDSIYVHNQSINQNSIYLNNQSLYWWRMIKELCKKDRVVTTTSVKKIDLLYRTRVMSNLTRLEQVKVVQCRLIRVFLTSIYIVSNPMNRDD